MSSLGWFGLKGCCHENNPEKNIRHWEFGVYTGKLKIVVVGARKEKKMMSGRS